MRQGRGVLGALLAVGIGLVLAAPAGAHSSGQQTFNGVIVASGVSGDRVPVSTIVVAKGVFNGVGKIVEVESLPSDPDNVDRDDLVFAKGTMHIVSTTIDASFSLNPKTCTFSATIQQTGEIEGGTGKFTGATGSSTATVTAHGLLARDPGDDCSLEQAPLFEVDTIASRGSLSF